MSAPRPLEVLRREIDRVDEAIVALLNERARLALEVGRRKAEDAAPVYAPHREQAVLEKVLALNQRPGSVLLPSSLEAIYRELMSGAISLERTLRIGYLGPPGSFSMEAAMRQFGKSVAYENLRSIDGVFEEVREREEGGGEGEGRCQGPAGVRGCCCAGRAWARRLRPGASGERHHRERGRDAGGIPACEPPCIRCTGSLPLHSRHT